MEDVVLESYTTVLGHQTEAIALVAVAVLAGNWLVSQLRDIQRKDERKQYN